MPRQKTTTGEPWTALLAVARRHPETEEGVACAGTVLESRTVKTRGKAFVFLSRSTLRLKLDASLAEAAGFATQEPGRYDVGSQGWVKVTFGDGELPLDVLARWIDESYRLVVTGPKKAMRETPADKKAAGKKPEAKSQVKSQAKSKAKSQGENASFVRVIEALKKDPRVTDPRTAGSKGFGSSGLKVGGKLFAMMSSKGKFVARLPRDRVAALVASGKGEFFDPGHGRLMKEWLAVSDDTGESWPGLAREALQFVAGV